MFGAKFPTITMMTTIVGGRGRNRDSDHHCQHTLAQHWQKSVKFKKDLISIEQEEPDDSLDVACPDCPAPKPPPGEHWTLYQDDRMVWHHYDGPLGQWWCVGEHGTIVPYHGPVSQASR